LLFYFELKPSSIEGLMTVVFEMLTAPEMFQDAVSQFKTFPDKDVLQLDQETSWLAKAKRCIIL
jgi:hypothetical protein